MVQKFGKVYQFSTMTGLAVSNFDGMINFDTLLKQGNFSLGTFDHLDGELIVLDGVCGISVKIRDGKVKKVSTDMTSPFCGNGIF